MGVGLAGFVVSAVLAAVLVPSAGATGAAWAYAGGLCALALLSLIALERRLAMLRQPFGASDRELPAAPMSISPRS